jgi:hypothetical protein
MATITPGSGATIKSNTAEGQLHELCTYLEINEALYSASNPTATIDNVTGNHLQNAATFSASFSIPVQQTINADGQIVYSATDYLNNLSFTSGSGGTFKSPTCAGYFIEVVIYLQNLEINFATNPEKRNYISGTFNSDSTVFSGAISLPITISIDNSGRVVYTAKEYLVNP